MKKRTCVFAITLLLILLSIVIMPGVGVFADAQPTITVSSPTNNLITDVSTVVIQGYVTDAATLDIDNVRVPISPDGFFSYSKALVLGQNSIVLKATSSSGLTNSVSLNVTYDPNAVTPFAVITNYPDGYVSTSQTIQISGYVYNNDNSSYTVNGVPFALGVVNGPFTTPIITLSPGDNTIVITATKTAGNKIVNQPIHIKYLSGGPTITNISPQGPKVNTGVVTFTGIVSGVPNNISPNGLRVSVNGGSWVTVNFDSRGNFSHDVSLRPGDNTIVFEAVNGLTRDTKTVNIRYEASPAIVITSPKNNDIVTMNTILITGKVLNTETNGLMINGERVLFSGDGTFSKYLRLDKFENDINFTATNGNLAATSSLKIYYSGIPNINITSHTAGDVLDTADTTFEGDIFPADHIGDFTINGVSNKNRISGSSFTSYPVTLQPGSNDVTFILTTTGFTTVTGVYLPPRTVTRIIKVDSNIGPEITVATPQDGVTVYSNIVNVSGILKRADFSTLKVGGNETKVSTAGNFSQNVTLKPGKNDIKIEAKLGDKTASKTITVYYDTAAIDIAEVRTKVNDGAEVKAFNDMIKVKLAKGSVRLDTTSILKMADPADCEDMPDESALIGPLVGVGWTGANPLKPYKVTLKYDDVVRDNQAHKVSVFYYYDGDWKVLGGVVDPRSRTISVETDKVGYFGAAMYYRIFDDVVNHWASRDIEYLVARGAIPLDSPYLFKPDTSITRAEFVTFLVKALGIQPYYPKFISYDDIDIESEYFGYVEAALRAGLVSGISHNKFAPDRSLTREEAAVLLARAGNMKPLKDQEVNKLVTRFTDEKSISSWARSQLAAAVKSKVLNGMADNSFRPQAETTRAEAAAMIVRLSELVNKIKY